MARRKRTRKDAVTIHVLIDRKEWVELAELADSAERTLSAEVRLAVRAYLESRRAQAA